MTAGHYSSRPRLADVPALEGAIAVGAIVDEVAVILAGAGYSDACLEAREIVAALHDAPRSWPVWNRDTRADPEMRARALRAARLRAAGAPLAYSAGRAAFRHLTLDVDDRVLIPRPETEQLIDIVLELLPEPSGGFAVDVGTGSGALALALAAEGTFDRIIGTDISLDALAVARANARQSAALLRAPVDFVHCSLLDGVREIRGGARLIVSNPPYIAFPEAVELPPSVRDWEPPVALFGGSDGMAITARLVRAAAAVLEPGGLLVVEVDARRASLAAELLGRDSRYQGVGIRLDLFGRERFVTARRR